MKVAEFKNYIKDKNIGVIGIGISNRPLIKYLVDAGANVTAYDKKTEGQLGDIAGQLIRSQRDCLINGHLLGVHHVVFPPYSFGI